MTVKYGDIPVIHVHPHSTPEMRHKAALNVAARVAGASSTPESRSDAREVLAALGLLGVLDDADDEEPAP